MAWDFKPGMRVVCLIEADPRMTAVRFSASYPHKGEVVTIREIKLDTDQTGLILLFDEHRNPHVSVDGFGECGFQARHFRPVREANIDSRRAHLAPRPRVSERA